MDKSDFYRNLIIVIDANIDWFSNIDEWTYSKDIDCFWLQNEQRKVKVAFKETKYGYKSLNVHPLSEDFEDGYTEDYNKGYDFSEIQCLDITKDVLYELCKIINNKIEELCVNDLCDGGECGIVLSRHERMG